MPVILWVLPYFLVWDVLGSVLLSLAWCTNCHFSKRLGCLSLKNGTYLSSPGWVHYKGYRCSWVFSVDHTWSSQMAYLVRALVAKPDNLSSILEPAWWEERTHSYRMPGSGLLRWLICNRDLGEPDVTRSIGSLFKDLTTRCHHPAIDLG